LLFPNFFSFINKYDIFFLYETHIVGDRRESFTNYFTDSVLCWVDATKTKRAGRASGGCLFGFKKSLNRTMQPKFEHFTEKNIYLSLTIDDERCLVIPRYLNGNNWNGEFECFGDFLSGFNASCFCIVGDLNAHVGEEQVFGKQMFSNFPSISFQRSSKDKTLDSRGRKVLKLFDNIGGIILNGRHIDDKNGEYTFLGGQGSSVIDYSVCSFSFLHCLKSFKVEQQQFSDHAALIMEVLCPHRSSNMLPQSNELPKKLFWRACNFQEYQSKLDNLVNMENIDSGLSVDCKLDLLLNKFKLVAPVEIKNHNFKPKMKWFDTQCYTARKDMLKHLNLFRKFKTESHRQQYLYYRSKYVKMCRRKKLQAKIRDIENLNSVRNVSEWWKLANSLKNYFPKLSNSVNIEDFYGHFRSLYEATNISCCIAWSMPCFQDPFLDAPFELRELKLVLYKCKPNKAPGLDRIGYEFYINAPDSFLHKMLRLFNEIFFKKQVPLSFRRTIIVPQFKKGNPNHAENYRGIMLANCSCKLFTALILERIACWVEFNKVINEYQARFRAGYSTADNVFNLTNVMHINFNQNKKTFAFFVDFRCAYDRILRNALFYKLASLGLSYRVVQILQALYNETSSLVYNGHELSADFATAQGLQQGCPLSPMLFTLFINDLHEALPGGVNIANTNIKILMYADDIVLISESSSELQNMINALYDYCMTWGLSVNLEKSKILVFRKSARISSTLAWKYGDEPIEVVNEYKYLGVLLTFNLSFKKHLNSKLIAAKTAINASWLSYVYNPRISVCNKLKIFEAAAKSIIFYCAQVWGFKEYEEVEKLLRFFVKKMLVLPSNTPNYMLHIETGLEPLFISSLRIHFAYVRRAIALPEDRLPHRLAKEILDKKLFWAKGWETLYERYGMSMITDTIDLASQHKEILNCISKDLRENFIENAQNSLHHDLYASLNHHVPPFLNLQHTTQISLIIKARGGLLNLNANVFRREPPFDCTICNMRQPENTYHLVGECPIYGPIRRQFLGNHFLTIDEVCEILNGKNFENLFNFLTSALKYRNLIINEFFS